MKKNEAPETETPATKPEEAPDFENGASIVIKFSVPDAKGNVQTSVDAQGMSIQHFKYLASLSDWYIKEEFPQEEQDKIANTAPDTIAENAEEHN